MTKAGREDLRSPNWLKWLDLRRSAGGWKVVPNDCSAGHLIGSWGRTLVYGGGAEIEQDEGRDKLP